MCLYRSSIRCTCVTSCEDADAHSGWQDCGRKLSMLIPSRAPCWLELSLSLPCPLSLSLSPSSASPPSPSLPLLTLSIFHPILSFALLLSTESPGAFLPQILGRKLATIATTKMLALLVGTGRYLGDISNFSFARQCLALRAEHDLRVRCLLPIYAI